MKKTLYLSAIIIIFSSLFIACSGGDEGSGGCGATVTNLTVTQQSDQLNFTITGTNALYYEISAVPMGSNMTPDQTNIHSVNSQISSIPANEIGVSQGCLFYVRAVCNDDIKGEWFGPAMFEIQPYCGTPLNLQMGGLYFSWDYYAPVGAEEYSNYQVEYGPQGFTHGTGTIVTVNNNMYSDFSLAAGQHYDFYVRGYCINNVGYGNWAGPVSYYAENNINMCAAPTNLSFTLQSNNGSYAMGYFSWHANGEDTFECALVRRNEAVEAIDIRTVHSTNSPTFSDIDVDYDHDFYVRAVCNNGSRTAWVKKQLNF
jgi:hypothetical protein